MRILLVANTLPSTDISGVGEQVLQLAAGFEARGHRVEVMSRTRRGLGRHKLLFPLTVVPRLLGSLRRFRPHVVQVHESDGALAALVTATVRALLEPRPAIIALLQVSYVQEWRAVRPLKFEGRVLGRPGGRELRFKWSKALLQVALGCLTAEMSDIVMAPSRRTAAELERDYQVRHVEVLPNVMGGRVVEAVSDPAVGEVDGCLLYVGRLRLRKALEVLFESLLLLPPGAPRLLVVGDGEHLGRLERRARQMKLGSRVVFLGRRAPGEVRYLMGRARALVVPSIYEGMPLVILEAMEHGLPVVATRVSGIPEVVEDGVTGWLVAAEDPIALAVALSEVAEQAEEAQARGVAGRQALLERFGTAQAVERWSQIVVESGPLIGPESGATDGTEESRR